MGVHLEDVAEEPRLVRGGASEVSVAEITGWVLLLLDVLNWAYWISITAWNVETENFDFTLMGITALAAPHTVIIPTLVAIMSDISKHCRSDGTCSLETPHLQWYFFPTLIVPYDALTLAYNIRAFGNERGSWAPVSAAAWSLFNSLLVVVWSYVNGWRMWGIAQRMPAMHAALLDLPEVKSLATASVPVAVAKAADVAQAFKV